MASELKIVRDEDGDVTGFTDPHDTGIPDYAVQNKSAAALVSGPTRYEFEDAIFMHPDTAVELEEAGVINILPDNQVRHDGVLVYLYESN